MSVQIEVQSRISQVDKVFVNFTINVNGQILSLSLDESNFIEFLTFVQGDTAGYINGEITKLNTALVLSKSFGIQKVAP